MTGKRKIGGKKTGRKLLRLTPKSKKSGDGPTTQLIPATPDEIDVCEVDWDSPKPVSLQTSETPVADIVANLGTKVDYRNDVTASPAFHLQYSSPSVKQSPSTPPKAPSTAKKRHQPFGKQLVFNHGIVDRMLAAISECKQRASTDTCASESLSELDTESGTAADVHQLVDKPPMPQNQSCDDLWTDTEDESFVRATQCLMDMACEPGASPAGAKASWPLVTSTPNMATSTPNIKKMSRRRPPPCESPLTAKGTFVVPSKTVVFKNTAQCASPVVGGVFNTSRETSFSDDLLASLAEPDDILDCQIVASESTKTVGCSSGPCNTLLAGGDAGRLSGATSSGLVSSTTVKADNNVCPFVSGLLSFQPPLIERTVCMRSDCNTTVGHESFQSDNDPFAQPEMFALMDQVEAWASQKTPEECLKSSTLMTLSDLKPTSVACKSSSLPSRNTFTSQLHGLPKSVNNGFVGTNKPCAGFSSAPGNDSVKRTISSKSYLRSNDEIERKRQEALKKCQTRAVKFKT